MFGFLSWVVCEIGFSSDQEFAEEVTFLSPFLPLHSNSSARISYEWTTGPFPRPPDKCIDRVSERQAQLFTITIYESQFARAFYTEVRHDKLQHVYPAFDLSFAQRLRGNDTLCNQGFIGNSDLYGCGIRIGIYLQWISSILANHLFSNNRQDIQKLYLIFSLAICVATLIATFVKACVFSVEIIILYWMYWGGYICVFGSAPCLIKLGNARSWMKVDWTTVIFFITHWIMAYHGVWFMIYAYDQHFPRMPCGTWHFFFAPVLDPGARFWVLRDWMSIVAIPIVAFVLIAFPLVAVLVLPEIKYAVQSSTFYQLWIHETASSSNAQQAAIDQPAIEVSRSQLEEPYAVIKTGQNLYAIITPNIQLSGRDLIKVGRKLYTAIRADQSKASWLGMIYAITKTGQSICRVIFEMPAQRRGGIRLITPADVKDRM